MEALDKFDFGISLPDGRSEVSEEEYKHRVNILQNKNEPKGQKKIRQEK